MLVLKTFDIHTKMNHTQISMIDSINTHLRLNISPYTIRIINRR